MSDRSTSYSRSDLLAHPELLLRFVPSEEGASVLVEARGDMVLLTPQSPISADTGRVLAAAKRRAVASPLSPDEARQLFVQERAAIADIVTTTGSATSSPLLGTRGICSAGFR